MAFVLDRPLYLTEDKKTVVEEGDPRARFVLGVAGSEIPDEQAKELGLLKAPAAEVTLTGQGKATQPEANKALAAKTNKAT